MKKSIKTAFFSKGTHTKHMQIHCLNMVIVTVLQWFLGVCTTTTTTNNNNYNIYIAPQIQGEGIVTTTKLRISTKTNLIL